MSILRVGSNLDLLSCNWMHFLCWIQIMDMKIYISRMFEKVGSAIDTTLNLYEKIKMIDKQTNNPTNKQTNNNNSNNLNPSAFPRTVISAYSDNCFLCACLQHFYTRILVRQCAPVMHTVCSSYAHCVLKLRTIEGGYSAKTALTSLPQQRQVDYSGVLNRGGY